jgi:hypothetical protein
MPPPAWARKLAEKAPATESQGSRPAAGGHGENAGPLPN